MNVDKKKLPFLLFMKRPVTNLGRALSNGLTAQVPVMATSQTLVSAMTMAMRGVSVCH